MLVGVRAHGPGKARHHGRRCNQGTYPASASYAFQVIAFHKKYSFV
jgi:hypothetical protein